MLLGLTPATSRQVSLLDLAPEERQRQRSLMAALDGVNRLGATPSPPGQIALAHAPA